MVTLLRGVLNIKDCETRYVYKKNFNVQYRMPHIPKSLAIYNCYIYSFSFSDVLDNYAGPMFLTKYCIVCYIMYLYVTCYLVLTYIGEINCASFKSKEFIVIYLHEICH